MSLQPFVRVYRERVELTDGEPRRSVFHSELLEQDDELLLSEYMAERIPLYYRNAEDVIQDLGDGYFLRAIRNSLTRLPTAENFQESHWCEILAAEFMAVATGMHLLYSKLKFLSAENANAFKMDLVMYDVEADPIEIVLVEVKSSMKGEDELPANHDGAAFASLFDSLREYEERDLQFDLATARAQLDRLPDDHAARLKEAFRAYAGVKFRFAGVCVIDVVTHTDDSELRILGTRASTKSFDVDVVCVVNLKSNVDAAFAKLGQIEELA